MQIDAKNEGETLVLTVKAPRVDALTAGAAQAAIAPHITPGVKRVVLDLGAVEYLSSAGLRTVVQTTKLVAAAGGRLGLCSLSPSVREIIGIAGFEGRIPILADRAAAAGEW